MTNNVKLKVDIDEGRTDSPAEILVIMEKEDGDVMKRELIPDQALQFAHDLEKNPKSTGIEFEKKDGEIEMVALPSEEVVKFAKGLEEMAKKAKEINEDKGFVLKEEYKEKSLKVEDVTNKNE